MQIAFLQSNWLRQYPFKAGTGLDLNGVPVPTDLLVGLRISVPHNSLNVYISRITTGNKIVGVEFFGDNGFLGSAAGAITTSNQTLFIKNNGGSIGTVSIGNPDSCIIQRDFQFDNVCGAVEPSTVTPVTLPALSGLYVRGELMTGRITLESNTLGISAAGNVYITVNNPADIASRGDAEAAYLTCDNPVIGGINNVVPDSDNNIDIFAILPLHIEQVTNGSITEFKLTIAPLTLSDLCVPYNIPPPNGDDEPATPLTSSSPEYLTWPQFN